jgi:hypothetical protein
VRQLEGLSAAALTALDASVSNNSRAELSLSKITIAQNKPTGAVLNVAHFSLER